MGGHSSLQPLLQARTAAQGAGAAAPRCRGLPPHRRGQKGPRPPRPAGTCGRAGGGGGGGRGGGGGGEPRDPDRCSGGGTAAAPPPAPTAQIEPTPGLPAPGIGTFPFTDSDLAIF